MTSSAGRKTIRITPAHVRSRGRDRAVVVNLTGSVLEFRLHGEKKRFSLTVGIAYHLAVSAHVASEKARRKAEREAKRRGKR